MQTYYVCPNCHVRVDVEELAEDEEGNAICCPYCDEDLTEYAQDE